MPDLQEVVSSKSPTWLRIPAHTGHHSDGIAATIPI